MDGERTETSQVNEMNLLQTFTKRLKELLKVGAEGTKSLVVSDSSTPDDIIQAYGSLSVGSVMERFLADNFSPRNESEIEMLERKLADVEKEFQKQAKLEKKVEQMTLEDGKKSWWERSVEELNLHQLFILREAFSNIKFWASNRSQFP